MNLLPRHFGVVIALSKRPACSTLLVSISVVVALSSREQMIWAAAWRIVAMVANSQTFRYWTIGDLIGEAVGEYYLPVFAYFPVAVFVDASGVNPAFPIWPMPWSFIQPYI